MDADAEVKQAVYLVYIYEHMYVCIKSITTIIARKKVI